MFYPLPPPHQKKGMAFEKRLNCAQVKTTLDEIPYITKKIVNDMPRSS